MLGKLGPIIRQKGRVSTRSSRQNKSAAHLKTFLPDASAVAAARRPATKAVVSFIVNYELGRVKEKVGLGRNRTINRSV